MYYIYFSYVAVLSCLVLYELYNKNQPRWWAVMVLLAPVTTPYFIFKFRRESRVVLVMIFLVTFFAVAAGESILYSKYMEKNKHSHLPPVARQMIRLADELKMTTSELDQALVKLETLSKVQSRIHEIKKTIEFIDELRNIMTENEKAIQRLVKYSLDYKHFFDRQDLEWVLNIQKFYQDRNVTQHSKSLEKYLDSFEALLKYVYVNFYNITELKSKEHFRNYDEFYLRYRRAVDAHNKFNVKRIDFQNSFLEKYPDIKPYLPGERQTETFKLWG